ncbi:MAG TPA: hypothetical protein VGO62_01900 [Myxococcota bacterium]
MALWLAVAGAVRAQAPTVDVARNPAVVDAQGKLASGDVDGALSALASITGPLAYEDVLARYETLGVARAYNGDAQGAEDAFKSLLLLAPGYALPYTLSPKATFPFEHARKALAGAPALEIVLTPPRDADFDKPIDIDVERASDPASVLASFRLCARVKGSGDEPECVTQKAPAVGAHSNVELAPVAAPKETAPVYLQLSLRGFDAGGSEIWRGPTPDRPRELGVGTNPVSPWYASPWLWGGVAAGVATVATTGTLLTLAALRPTNVPTRYEVKGTP